MSQNHTFFFPISESNNQMRFLNVSFIEDLHLGIYNQSGLENGKNKK